jgi:hypothetical protein
MNCGNAVTIRLLPGSKVSCNKDTKTHGATNSQLFKVSQQPVQIRMSKQVFSPLLKRTLPFCADATS